ncbi:MAG: hypothetical protein H6577_26050 [Lewinellaceae bacterium]|nr:hypothetical protein [Lewinellaceae bacterium]
MTSHFLDKLFEKAAVQPSTFAIAAGLRHIRFHFPDEALRQYCSPPFSHLAANGQTADLDIFCFLHPLDVTAWLAENQLDNRPHKTIRHNSILYCSQENGLFWLDENRRKGFFLGNGMDALEPYHSKPFSRLLCWFFENLGLLWCHGACIGSGNGGVLLPGIGGAGKSTTVGAALLGGLQLLGDDYLLIEPESRTVFGLYSSLMLAEESREMLRQFPNATLLRPEFLGNKDKWCHYLHPAFAPQLGDQLPLRAILIPQIVQQPDSFISPASQGEVMNALVSSLQTVWLMGIAPGRLLREYHTLTASLPLGKLHVGSDLTQVPALVNAYLNGGQI